MKSLMDQGHQKKGTGPQAPVFFLDPPASPLNHPLGWVQKKKTTKEGVIWIMRRLGYPKIILNPGLLFTPSLHFLYLCHDFIYFFVTLSSPHVFFGYPCSCTCIPAPYPREVPPPPSTMASFAKANPPPHDGHPEQVCPRVFCEKGSTTGGMIGEQLYTDEKSYMGVIKRIREFKSNFIRPSHLFRKNFQAFQKKTILVQKKIAKLI